jgi:hypothetical protein
MICISHVEFTIFNTLCKSKVALTLSSTLCKCHVDFAILGMICKYHVAFTVLSPFCKSPVIFYDRIPSDTVDTFLSPSLMCPVPITSQLASNLRASLWCIDTSNVAPGLSLRSAPANCSVGSYGSLNFSSNGIFSSKLVPALVSDKKDVFRHSYLEPFPFTRREC